MEKLDKRIEELSSAKRALLELRLKQRAAVQGSVPAIVPRKTEGPALLSFAQQRLWFLDQIESNRALYNVPRALRLKGKLDATALRRALDQIAARHETLRTHFSVIEGEARQIIDPEPETHGRDAHATQWIPFSVIDLSKLSSDQKESEIRKVSEDEAKAPFDLSTGLLLRATLVQIAEGEHLLLLTNHHIISDAWSGGIFFNELGEIYNSIVEQRPAVLPDLKIQFADFAEWQRNWLRDDELERQLSYWRNQLKGISSVLELPTDHLRSSAQQSSGAYRYLELPSLVSQQLNELSRSEGVTLFMTLLAAFQILLSRYSGQSDIVIGSPIAGRNRAEVENLIGFFINTLALRSDLSQEKSFREFLQETKETALGAYAHQDLPFEKLVEELHPERDLGRNPIFQVMFQFQSSASRVLDLKDLEVTPLETSTGTSKFDLMMATREEHGNILCVLEYNTGLFDADTIDRMLEHYATLLSGIVARPDDLISRLPLMTKVEAQRILKEWNETSAEFPRDQTIHELFEEQVARTPDATALISGTDRVSFSELNQRANQMARYLQKHSIGSETTVAVCLNRSVDMIVCLFGILKAGGTYVPLEPTFPAERISFIVEDSNAAMVLTQESDSPAWTGPNLIFLDDIREELAKEDTAKLAAEVSAQQAAHVIYTSGSTGRPKGVVSPHSASINRFAWMWQHHPFGEKEVCCQKTALSFVDSIWEIFGPLLKGVPLVLLPDEISKDPFRLITSLSVNKVTRLVLVPSLLRSLLEFEDNLASSLSDLRICVCSGETLPEELAAEFHEKLPNAKLINLYGSSEVAADVTCFEVNADSSGRPVPIGRPIANTRIYLLDDHLQNVPIGVQGEIFVGGEGLARGYLNNPVMTAERFIPDPFGSGERLFQTGDLGRYLPDGNIECRGRSDHQIKLRGFRIELGEIEATIKVHVGIVDAVVVLHQSKAQAGDKQLVAYVVAGGEPISGSELRSYLREKLPDYMIPSVFVALEALPLTTSGKVNRLALPEPVSGSETASFVAPRTPTEDILANIWADEMGLEVVGVDDDFFALGGHSLLLARIAARIREVFDVDLSLRTLFENTSVALLSEQVEFARRSNAEVIGPPLVPISRDGKLPLSFAEERLWFFDQLEPNSSAYNIGRALKLTGPLDRKALQQSLDAMFERHEVLRTIIRNVEGKPELAFTAKTPTIRESDLSEAGDVEKSTKTFVKEETEKPFDLSSGPLLRVALARIGEQEHVLVLTMHHIISDGRSVGIARRELIAGYNASLAGFVPSFPALKLQYADYASWQRESLTGNTLEKQLEFWRSQLNGAPRLMNLPADRPRPSVRSFAGARQAISVSAETSQALKQFARAERSTLFMTLLTSFQFLLACLTGDDDVVVGSPTAGRNHSETENLIGYFVNTLVLRTRMDGALTFRKALRQVRDTAMDAFAHQDVPFEKLVDELGAERSLEFNPLFQVWFVLQNAIVEREEWRDLKAEPITIESSSTRHDLQLAVWENEKEIEGAFTYSTDLFDAESIGRFAEQFRVLLSYLAEDPELTLGELRLRLVQAGRDYELQRAARLTDDSREKLRSVKRRAVTGTSSATLEA